MSALSVVLHSCRLGHLTKRSTPSEGGENNSVRQFEWSHLVWRQQGIRGAIHRLYWRRLSTFSWHCARNSHGSEVKTRAKFLMRIQGLLSWLDPKCVRDQRSRSRNRLWEYGESHCLMSRKRERRSSDLMGRIDCSGDSSGSF